MPLDLALAQERANKNFDMNAKQLWAYTLGESAARACMAIVDAQLAQVQSRGQPTQAKCSGQANQNPNEIKFHD